MKNTLLKISILLLISILPTGCTHTIYKNATRYDFMLLHQEMSSDYYGVSEHIAKEINSFKNAGNDIDILEIKIVNGCFNNDIEYKRIWYANNQLNGIHNGKGMVFTADDAIRFATVFENISTDHIYISNPFNGSTLRIRDSYYIKVKGKDTYTFSLDSNLKETATAGREELFKYALYINSLNADSL